MLKNAKDFFVHPRDLGVRISPSPRDGGVAELRSAGRGARWGARSGGGAVGRAAAMAGRFAVWRVDAPPVRLRRDRLCGWLVFLAWDRLAWDRLAGGRTRLGCAAGHENSVE